MATASGLLRGWGILRAWLSGGMVPAPHCGGGMRGLAPRHPVKASDSCLSLPWLQGCPQALRPRWVGERQQSVAGKAKSPGLPAVPACLLEGKVLIKGREPGPHH